MYEKKKSVKHEWKSKCLSSPLPVSRSNLSPVLPDSGNTSFPGETKLSLYPSGPQVSRCSLTVSCKRRGERGTFSRCQSLARRTQIVFVMASAFFSKGSRVPYHWFCSQLACNSRLRRLMCQTHNESLFVWGFVFVFFFPPMIFLIMTSFCHCSCGFGARRSQQRSEGPVVEQALYSDPFN